MKNARMLEFDVRCGGRARCPLVIDYPEIASGILKIIPINGTPIKITSASVVGIKFEYPLTRPVRFEFRSSRGFELIDLFRCVYEEYSKIYAAESDPGTNGMSLNRARSEGPYGIWGHYLDDLFLEAILEISPNEFELGIGS